jgi:hypothetical protein
VRNTTLFKVEKYYPELPLKLRNSAKAASVQSPKSGISEYIALIVILNLEDFKDSRTSPFSDWLGELDLQRGHVGLFIMQAG